jgi:hypothetical protein
MMCEGAEAGTNDLLHAHVPVLDLLVVDDMRGSERLELLRLLRRGRQCDHLGSRCQRKLHGEAAHQTQRSVWQVKRTGH